MYVIVSQLIFDSQLDQHSMLNSTTLLQQMHTHNSKSRDPFQVPNAVSWHKLSEALYCYFYTQTGRGLTPQSLEYLGQKLLDMPSEEDLSQKSVGRQRICKVSHKCKYSSLFAEMEL